ncbi:MAG: type II secretion system protein [Candidatus Pacebacteria bacterium]|nr:type II secretion system protein [Candidatus Paceibacterota bacterium]
MKEEKFKQKKSDGFTLLETMIVITVFAIAAGAIFSAQFYGQKIFMEQQDLAEITQNGRIIMERITREIRQSKQISNNITEEEITAASEIEFQDGHLGSFNINGSPQSASTSTIALAADSSPTDDFYKDSFMEITSGWGNENNKIRKITGYDGSTKAATIDRPWENPIPTVASIYSISSDYYYIRYFASSTELYKEVKVYYFPSDPYCYLPHNATSSSEILTSKLLEGPELVGEFVQGIKFWGNKLINIKINLAKNEQLLEIENKILGRNL